MTNFFRRLGQKIVRKPLSADIHMPLSESREEWMKYLGLELNGLGYESKITDWYRLHEVQFNFTCQSGPCASMKIMAQQGGPMEFTFAQPEKLHTKPLLHFSVGRDGNVAIDERSKLMRTATPQEHDYLQNIISPIRDIVFQVIKGGVSGMVAKDGTVTVDPVKPVGQELYNKLESYLRQLLVKARIDRNKEDVEVNIQEQEHTDLAVALRDFETNGREQELDLGIRHTKDANGQPVKAIITLVNKKYGNQQGLGVALQIKDNGDIVARVGKYYSNGEAFRILGESDELKVGNLDGGIAEETLRNLIGRQMDLYEIYLPLSVFVAGATYSLQNFINTVQQ